MARTKPRTQARFYGSREWKALRRRVRLEEPTCTICHAAATTDVHHRDGDWRNTARSNLTGVCRHCHASLTAEQQNARRAGRPERPIRVRGCDEHGIPLDPATRRRWTW